MITTTLITRGVDYYDKEDPPPRGEVRKEGQGKEEGLVSAKEVHCTAIQVDNGNASFLSMAEAMITTVTTTTLSSTVALGALLSLGAGAMTIIPG